MTSRIARRAACVAASVTLAVAGLLAAGSAATAAEPGHGDQARHGSPVRIDDARRAWALDQVQWALDHDLIHQGR